MSNPSQNGGVANDDVSTESHPWTDEAKEKFEGKGFSKHYDPCQEAADRSIKCLHRNPGNKDLCKDYFQIYRDCKQAWQDKRREQRIKEGKFF